MPNTWFDFKQFRVVQKDSAFKVGTDGVLLGAWCSVEGDGMVLDIGSGTGLIALMIAQRSSALITAIEPDSLSAKEARLNFDSSPWSDRLQIENISLQDFKNSGKKFDHIVSNPPYFTSSLLNDDSRVSGARHNYSLSSKQILEASSEMLNTGGKLSVILPYTEANLMIAEASDYSLYCNRMLNIKPLPGKAVKRILLEFSNISKPLTTGILVVETGKRHSYSHEYRGLTGDFYLNF